MRDIEVRQKKCEWRAIQSDITQTSIKHIQNLRVDGQKSFGVGEKNVGLA